MTLPPENIFVVGSSGHAAVIIDILEKQGHFRIAGLIDTFAAPGKRFLDYEVLGPEHELPRLCGLHSARAGIVAIGDNYVRSQVVHRILEILPEFRFVTAVHPSAQIARGVTIDPGTAVMAGVVINTNARVGSHCILNTNSSLDHDSAMEDFSSLGPGAATGGKVRVGRFSVLAQGANVIHGIRIGEHAVVGAGATVLQDLPGYVVAYGSPARIIRPRTAGEEYL
jgi:sugar O-acyltransferase (sialic acid O-acetyltransferase NeuD family)